MDKLEFKYRKNGQVGAPWSKATVEIMNNNKGILTLDFDWTTTQEDMNFFRLFDEYIIDVEENLVICLGTILNHAQVEHIIDKIKE